MNRRFEARGVVPQHDSGTRLSPIRRATGRLGAVIACLALAGCATEEVAVPGPDGSVRCAHAGDCPAEAPVCNDATGLCVECTGEGDCASGACDPASHRCVECVAPVDCTDPAAAACDPTTHTCTPCTANADCESVPGDLAVCHEGTCVACTPETEATDCGPPDNHACDPNTFTCTGAERGTLGFCQPCVSDSECQSDPTQGTLRCVAMTYGDPPEPHGTYCLLDLQSYRDAIDDPAALCPNQQPVDRVTKSVLDTEDHTYCFPREAITTCEAILGFGDGCTADEDCGAEGLDDGLCRGGTQMTCTYRCMGGMTSRDCGSGVACTGVTPTYCDPN